ncbi:sulfite exporter TauE/SafE family protein [Acuticoccus mangrovi]|uniref:Probable membrane transporter protein n=1 Tax=Acuticoccus mangrovi TaxID=2796142 RepID=A0A934MHM1_9HYPH|nr:sulfite exporter TauE/SafE family protein [Acuticoccus mangrovi]MBJ3776231.1 sulfite exporter TauE/SafE family protein [Acuticoccus mangrovi]
MMPHFSPLLWIAIIAITLTAGLVKGLVGFAMPMIMISGLSSVLPPDVALGALIVPTLATNLLQALRQGWHAAIASVRAHRRYVAVVVVVLAFSAQLVAILPSWVLFLVLGTAVVTFACIQLAGLRIHIPPERRTLAEVFFAALSGFFGGMSGVWGPTTVMYLTALDTPKTEQIRVQGIVYGLAAVALTIAHTNSGAFNATTAPLSVLLLIPALAGLVIGVRLHDRLDQDKFRRATLAVLVIAGLNLVRRGLFS